MLGYSEEELRRLKITDITVRDEESELRRALEAIPSGHTNRPSVEERYRTKSGQVVWVQVALSIISDHDGRPLYGIGVVENITDRKRAEEERQRLQMELIQAQKMEAVGRLAGGVAHDFNNILTAFLMHLGLLQSDPGIGPTQKAALKELEEHARRATNLTRQLLMFSRRQVMQPRNVDLNELLTNLLKMLGRLIGEHITLEFKSAPEHLWVEVDVGMVEQVVMNLVVNARDAMPTGGTITLATERARFTQHHCAWHHEARPGEFIRLTVSDTGCGMEEQTVGKIFEPFFTTKEAGKGTGLGLATVYGIVQQHQGWIEVRSAFGKGSSFHVYLPAVAPGGRPAKPDAEEEKPVPEGNETILLVEDEVSVRTLTAMLLRRLGYQVLEAGNGPEALAVWEQPNQRVDLLLTDMVMPGGMTGLELAQTLRGRKPALRVIVLSGYSTELLQADVPPSRKFHVVSKPVEIKVLAQLIRKSLLESPSA
ncbi:MAG TPA: ATP-binding protein [Clostridia bacterium]|nr:ATP-binding protein [Clostridia bacterium]